VTKTRRALLPPFSEQRVGRSRLAVIFTMERLRAELDAVVVENHLSMLSTIFVSPDWGSEM
jgi:hypothetical protein